MRCQKCNFENPAGAKFCVECGNKFEVPCPACGFDNLSTFKFCAECGEKLAQSPKPAPESLSIDARVDAMSLEILRLIGYPDLSGTAEGRLRIMGSPENPHAVISISIYRASIKRVAVSRDNPVSMAAQGILEEGIFCAEGSVEGLSEKPIRADLRVPVILSLSPFDFHLLS